MKTLLSTLFGILICCNYLLAQTPSAEFTAKECIKEVYRQGFDTTDDLKDWTLSSTNKINTWALSNPRPISIPNFKTINPTSINSLAIKYDDNVYQNEILTSPEMTIADKSSCTLYTCFDGVYIFWANFTIEVLNTQTQKKDMLFNAFVWSQESGHERPKWLFFKFDLAEYANQKVQFVFTYKGQGGDDVLIDDFCIIQASIDETSVAEIKEGEQVHFEDLSTGNPTSWEWTFEGGEPSTSTEQNPVITYKKAGSYPVKLVAKNANGSDERIKNNFVVAKGVAPVATIGWPKEGYLSPYTGIFVPTKTNVQFTDASKNLPTAWKWTLPGSQQQTSTEQNPVVQYPNEGTYHVALQVSNSTGTDIMQLENVLQAGGEQNIWNIELDEVNTLGVAQLGFFGYYGGTNWLDMSAFAEYYNKPAAPGSISEVSVFFATATTVTPDTTITVSIAKAANGLPGAKLASSSILAKDLVYDENTWVATDFKFEQSVEINDEFFVIIEGFPNNSTNEGTDDIAIGCTAKRPDGGKSTVFHLLEEWDNNNQPTGKFEWFKNEDEFISFMVAPLFTYKNKITSIENLNSNEKQVNICPSVIHRTIEFYNPDEIQEVAIYTTSGQQIYLSTESTAIPVSTWEKGFYIIRVNKNGKALAQKIQIVN